jgi:hypothetical protein
MAYYDISSLKKDEKYELVFGRFKRFKNSPNSGKIKKK